MPRPLSLSLSDHHLDWAAEPWPVDWTRVFGREADLALEIGFGNGDFIADQAARRPERNHVGIELSWSGARRLFKRLDKAGVTNVRALLLDAEVALTRLFEPESLAEVFVNHPCPWPKARHHRRRLLHPDGLAWIADRMRMQAQLTVVTDHAEYAEFVAQSLGSQDVLASCHAGIEVEAIAGRLTTKYERKALAQGISIHYFEWKKVHAVHGVAAPERTSLDPMPSLTLRGAPADPFSGFAPILLRERHQGTDVIVRLTELFQRAQHSGPPAWRIDAMVQESGLRQDFSIHVVQREAGELLVKLADPGRPHPTHGVRRALFGVAAWIRERHPEAQVTHENLGPAAMGPLAPVDAAEA